MVPAPALSSVLKTAATLGAKHVLPIVMQQASEKLASSSMESTGDKLRLYDELPEEVKNDTVQRYLIATGVLTDLTTMYSKQVSKLSMPIQLLIQLKEEAQKGNDNTAEMLMASIERSSSLEDLTLEDFKDLDEIGNLIKEVTIVIEETKKEFGDLTGKIETLSLTHKYSKDSSKATEDLAGMVKTLGGMIPGINKFVVTSTEVEQPTSSTTVMLEDVAYSNKIITPSAEHIEASMSAHSETDEDKVKGDTLRKEYQMILEHNSKVNERVDIGNAVEEMEKIKAQVASNPKVNVVSEAPPTVKLEKALTEQKVEESLTAQLPDKLTSEIDAILSQPLPTEEDVDVPEKTSAMTEEQYAKATTVDTTQSDYWQKEDTKKSLEVFNNLKDELFKAKETIEYLQQDVKHLETENMELRVETLENAMNASILEEMKRRSAYLEDESTRLNNTIKTLNTKVTASSEEIKRMKMYYSPDEVKVFKDKIQSLQMDADKLNQECEELSDENDQLYEQIKAIQLSMMANDDTGAGTHFVRGFKKLFRELGKDKSLS